MAGEDRRGSGVRSVVGDVLKRIDPEHRLKAFEVWTFWNDAVGERLARRAQPSGYRNGVLFVTVGAHSWLQELQFVKDALLDRLNARLGEEMIRDIYFVSGALDADGATPGDAAETAADAVPSRSIELPHIADPDLAAAFERVVRAHVRRGPRDAARRRRTRS
jgi:hypothetical protein